MDGKKYISCLLVFVVVLLLVLSIPINFNRVQQMVLFFSMLFFAVALFGIAISGRS